MATKCAECGHEHENWLPKERYDKLLISKKEADTAAKTARGEIATLENKLAEAGNSTATIESLNGRIAELEGQRDGWDLQKSIMTAGVSDAEGLGVIAMLYNALPEDKRPEGGVKAWLESEDAPRAAKTYMPEVKPADPKDPKQPEPAKPPGIPSANTGAKPAGPPNTGEYSAEALGSMSLAEYAQHRNNVRAQRGLPPIENKA